MPLVRIMPNPTKSGPVSLTVHGRDDKGKAIEVSREIPREKEVEITDAEYEALMHSYEKNYIFVYPEVKNGGTDRTERPDPDSGGDEESPRKGGIFRGTGESA